MKQKSRELKSTVIIPKQPTLISFKSHYSSEALLSVFSCQDQVPFLIKRVFVVDAKQNCTRGFHAHKTCAQLMVLLRGSCTVVSDDGTNRNAIKLLDASQGLLIPPMIWAEQKYERGSLLMVLTNDFYDEDDYIRDYDMFLQVRKKL